tara:strand:- start:601 stop:744 length:144 start_codon:yes stop_codon:yes gene_type:complete
MKNLLDKLKDYSLGGGLMFIWAAFAFFSTAFFIAVFIKVIQRFLIWL